MSEHHGAQTGQRLRELRPISGPDGACELVYDLERTAVLEVPRALSSALMGELATLASGGRVSDQVREWLEEEELLTPCRDTRSQAAPLSPEVSDFSFDLSGACNLGCAYCFENDIGSRTGPMSEETALSALDFAFAKAAKAPRLTLHFGSGEPLLRFDLLQKVVAEALRRGRRAGKEVGFELTTNGTLVTPETARFLARHPFVVQVSSDGPPHLHNPNRPFQNGKGSYDAVISGLRLLLRELPERLTLNVVLTATTRLAEIWSWTKGLGVRQLNVIKVGTYDDGLTRLERQQLRHFINDLQAIADELCREVEAGRRPLVYTPLTKHVLRLVKGQPKTRYCGVAGSYLGVASTGKVYPCFRHAGVEEYELGHIASGIDETRRFEFRAQLAADVDHRRTCRDCWARYLCGGGCYADSTVYGKDPHGPQVQHCDFWRTEVETAIRLYHRLRQRDPLLVLALFGNDPKQVLHGMGLDMELD